MLKVIEVEGKGAKEFLDRVTAGTVRKVEVGQGSPGVLLNGQSRMIAQFDLLRMADELYWLVSPEECASALAENLERVHFAEELEIRISPIEITISAGPGERGRIFSWSGSGDALHWPTGVNGFIYKFGNTSFPAEWDFARIGAGIPWPVLDWDSNTPALEAGQLFAIDREKGCYPGQEVVELSLNVGHPVRVLLSIEGEQALSCGEKMKLLPQGEGSICSVASRGKTTRAFLRVLWAMRESLPANFRKIRK